MAAAIGHNQGGSLWGALCDGKDQWRFYRMIREDHDYEHHGGKQRGGKYPHSGGKYPPNPAGTEPQIHCDEFRFGDFGEAGLGDAVGAERGEAGEAVTSPLSPYSYHIQVSPTLSVRDYNPLKGSLKVVDYALSLTHHDWMGCTDNLYRDGAKQWG